MAEAFIGEIRIFGFNFPPNGWMACNGQLLPIGAGYDALYTLIGTTYGGDGVATFALPNLQGRVPVHQGTGAGLSTYVLGEMTGSESVTLLPSQIPMHNHALNAYSTTGSAAAPANGYPANPQGSVNGSTDGPFLAPAIGSTGGSQPHSNLQPFLALNFCICVLAGIFPSRN